MHQNYELMHLKFVFNKKKGWKTQFYILDDLK